MGESFEQRGRDFPPEFWEEIAASKVRHRANGCKVYDLPMAKCTCPDPDLSEG